MQNILPILIFNALSMTAIMAFLPVAGPIVRELGLKEWHAGAIIAVSGLFWMLFARFWGRLSDRRGRRSILLFAGVGFSFSYAVFAFFIDKALSVAWSLFFVLSAFILIRAVMGAFYAALPTVGAAHIADITSLQARESGMALFGASNGLGMVAGPLFAGMLARYSLTLPLYAGMGLSVLALLIAFFTLSKRYEHRAQQEKPVRLNDPRLRLSILTVFLASGCAYTADVCIGFYGLDVLGLNLQTSAEYSGYAMGIVGITMIITQLLMSRFRQVKDVIWLAAGSLFAALGFLLVVCLASVLGLLLGYGVVAIGLSMLFPAAQALASRQMDVDEQGIAAGTVSAAQGLAMIIVPVLATLLYQMIPQLPYLSATLLLLALFVYVLLKAKHITLKSNAP